MKSCISLFVGLLLSVSVSAEPLLEGQVRLSSGAPAAGVQVRLFDLTNLHQSVGTTTDETGHFTLSLPAAASGSALPQGFALGQNYPNPFNPSTIIPYQIPTATHVRLEVFNVLGQRVATLVDAERPAGFHTAQWTATDATGQAVGAGVYFYRLVSGGATVSRRMVLIDGQAGSPAAGAAGPMQASALEQVEADAGVYGLTVSGAGVVAYVNPAFRVGVDEAEIVLEAASGSPRMKRTAGGILGDVNNDGQVDAYDLLYVALYSEDSSITLPNNGDITLGDLNKDGTVDFADAMLLIRYLADPSDPSLPAGIGEPVEFGPAADLIVERVGVGTDTLAVGESFTLFAMVRNRGDAAADSTTLRYYQSMDATISASDTQVGTAPVKVLAASSRSNEAISLTASAGTYYYGACVESVSGESNTDNNCSTGVRVVVESGPTYSGPTYTALDAPFGLALDVASGKMYWTDWSTDKIQRANLDGSDVEDLVTTGVDFPAGLALDVASGKMYWTDSDTDKIQRANLDGSGVETLVSTGVEAPVGIALDVAGGKMYWTDQDTEKIQRANLDGRRVETLVSTGVEAPSRIALDVAGGKMYWTDVTTDKIQRANLDGSDVEDLVTTGLETPFGLALDVAGGKMYWTDAGTDKIQRANLDGSGVETLVSTGVEAPFGLALDVAAGKMYWTDWSTVKIQRANLDGSQVQNLVEPALSLSVSNCSHNGRGTITITGRVTAKTTVSNLRITGFVSGQSSGTRTQLIGKLIAGQSRSFSIPVSIGAGGVVIIDRNTRCGVRTAYVVTTGSGKLTVGAPESSQQVEKRYGDFSR